MRNGIVGPILQINFVFFLSFFLWSTARCRGQRNWPVQLVLLAIAIFVISILPLEWALRARGPGRDFMILVSTAGLILWPIPLSQFLAGSTGNRGLYFVLLLAFEVAFAIWTLAIGPRF